MPRELIYKDEAYSAVLHDNPRSAYCINRMKPVDAVEVVHSEWIDAYGIRKSKCKHCGVAFGRVMDGDCYYCPNCGAKMDGEEKENGKP